MFARSQLASIFPSAGNNASELVLRGLPRQNRPIASGGFEIADFRYGRPYFGFADHVK
jgi:hypothetical protein